MQPFDQTIELIFTAPVRNVRVDGLNALPVSSAPTLVWKGSLGHLDVFRYRHGYYPAENICLKLIYEDEFGKRIETLCGWLPTRISESP